MFWRNVNMQKRHAIGYPDSIWRMTEPKRQNRQPLRTPFCLKSGVNLPFPIPSQLHYISSPLYWKIKANELGIKKITGICSFQLVRLWTPNQTPPSSAYSAAAESFFPPQLRRVNSPRNSGVTRKGDVFCQVLMKPWAWMSLDYGGPPRYYIWSAFEFK